MNLKSPLLLATVAAILSACATGPAYQKPSEPLPAAFKENAGWKLANPQDLQARGNWWEIYGDAALNDLVAQVKLNNQNVRQFEAQYRQARAAAQAAHAGFWPTVSAGVSDNRSGSGGSNGIVKNNFNASLDASWEPDLWGKVANTVDAGEATSQASTASLAGALLSAQAELVQDYLQLRVLDAEQDLFDQTVAAYAKSLQLTKNQYNAGIVTRADVAQAETQWQSAQAQQLDLGIQRAQLEHAIAILIGKAPADFTLAKAPVTATLPAVPAGVPSDLLERRPDIAAAERKVAAANANIGVARAAFFPALTLSASGGFQNSSLSQWFNAPSQIWSLGLALAETIFDGGLRKAQSEEVQANYDNTVAAYRQTVLGGLQEVEDNLATLRILEQEAKAQTAAVTAAQDSARLALNQYKAGTTSYLNVATAQATLLSSQRSMLQLQGRQWSASVLLIKALGGGWRVDALATKP
ncbi:efflux transporter outer membrane subunit [Andreprevotia chitinilytica]|uniref:efflux transporter outer membrane subunit n=1 Tax=Andreprevotia chitinilytica TaxID=396808 RepID=UPI000A50757E|nr:efflux transporter outer membrane subunit [Andreprevotia chitinilytica]